MATKHNEFLETVGVVACCLTGFLFFIFTVWTVVLVWHNDTQIDKMFNRLANQSDLIYENKHNIEKMQRDITDAYRIIEDLKKPKE